MLPFEVSWLTAHVIGICLVIPFAWCLARWITHPQLRHILWVAVLLKLMMPIGLGISLAPLVDRIASENPSRIHESAPSAKTVVVDQAKALAYRKEARKEQTSPSVNISSFAPSNDSQANAVDREIHSAGSVATLPSWSLSQALLAVWLFGSLTVFLLLVVRSVRFHRGLRRDAIIDIDMQHACNAIVARTSIRSPPSAMLTNAVVSPMLWVMGRPKLIFPRQLWNALDEPGRHSLLSHEIAHLARRDHWVRRLEVMASLVWWWHPALWLARRELRSSEEECCDRWVIAHAGTERRRYANAILETLDFLADSRPSLPPVACGLGRITSFERRFVMIMHAPIQNVGTAARIGVTLLALAILLIKPNLAEEPPKIESVVTQSDSGGQSIRIINPRGIRIEGADVIEIESSDSTSKPEVDFAEAAPSLLAAVPAPNEETFLAQVAPEGKSFATVGFDSKVRIFANDGRQLRVLDHPDLTRPLTQLVFWRDGSRIAAGGFDGLIVVWNAKTGDVVGSAKQQGGIRSLSISDDDQWLVSGSWDSQARVWDAKSLEEVNHTPSQSWPVIADISPDGQLVATVTGEWKNWRSDGELKLWDRESLSEVKTLKGHRYELKGVRFSPDGKRLLTFGSDATARLWDVKSGRGLVIYQHPAAVTAATFIPNSDLIATGDNNGTVRFWQASDHVVGPKPRETSRPESQIKAHEKLIYRLNFTPDGSVMLSNSPDRMLKLWQTKVSPSNPDWTLQKLAQ